MTTTARGQGMQPIVHLWQDKCADQVIYGAFVRFASFLYVWVGDAQTQLTTFCIAVQTVFDTHDDASKSTSCSHLLGLSDMNESLARRLSELFTDRFIVSVSIQLPGLDDANGQLLRVWLEKRLMKEIKFMNLNE